VLGASRLLAMAKDIGDLRFIIIGEVFLWLISHSIVLQLFGGHFRNTYPPISLEYQPLEAMKPFLLASEPSLTCTLTGPWCKSMLKTFLISFFGLLFIKSCVIPRGLWRALSLLPSCFYGAPSFLYYQHGRHVEGVTIIESSSSTKQGDPLGGPLFPLTHYQTLLKTIVWAPNCVFPSLMDDTHIMKPMNELSCTFD
jgi:hypothetical protein